MSPDDTPILFLPGMSGLGEFWDPVRERITDRTTSALDWPGLGGAPADPTITSYDGFVELVTSRLTEPTILVGQSMGGYVAARVALAVPERVAHLVLAVTSAGLDMAALGAVDWRPASRAAHPDAPSWVFDPQPDLSEQLATLPMPTLLLWADADPISPLTVGRRLAELMPHAELVVYPSDDHWVVRHRAADVTERILALG